jgi:putative transposase
VLLRLSYLALTGMFAFLRLLPTGSTDKDIEILALRHQLAVLQRQVVKPRLTPPHPTACSSPLYYTAYPDPTYVHST